MSLRYRAAWTELSESFDLVMLSEEDLFASWRFDTKHKGFDWISSKL